jgi:hypothetical protein
MNRPSIHQLRDELERLMREHIDTMQKQTFVGLSAEEFRREQERVERIREVSADFLEALKNISS